MMVKKTISRHLAAALLGVSTRSIDRWIREGRINAFKPFGSRRVLIYFDSLTQENLQSPKPIFSNKF